MNATPHILCVNPWVHDFAAYDVWAKPLGLLYLAALLRDHGCRVSYIDCLDRFHPREAERDPSARCGRGPYRKTRIRKPSALADVPRHFSRYGIDPAWFAEDLAAAGRPDLVLVTSLMTYWYTGIAETVNAIRSVFPGVPILLGGIYATLCAPHARGQMKVDEVISGAAEDNLFGLVAKYTGINVEPRYDPADMNHKPYPALDHQHRIAYAPLLTAKGCPFSCDYCASHILQPRRMRRRPDHIVGEIRYWNAQYGVRDFAFYDDALLVDAQAHAAPLFEMLGDFKPGIRLHTPNALHMRGITPKMASLMRGAGMKTLRLGLETTEFDRREMDRKVCEAEFVQAAAYLKEAGFTSRELGAYLLAGLPGQSPESVEASIDIVKAAGITPIIAHFSPIPGTKMWDAALAASRYDLDADPIYTNNAVMPCQPAFSWELISRFKKRIEA